METISNFLQENPRYFFLLLIVGGIALFIYTLKTDSKKLLQNTTNKYHNQDFAADFGTKSASLLTKIVYFIVSIVLILLGIVMVISGN